MQQRNYCGIRNIKYVKAPKKHHLLIRNHAERFVTPSVLIVIPYIVSYTLALCDALSNGYSVLYWTIGFLLFNMIYVCCPLGCGIHS